MSKLYWIILGVVGVGAAAALAMGGEDVVAQGQNHNPDTDEVADWKVTKDGDKFRAHYKFPGEGWTDGGEYGNVGLASTAAINILFQEGFTEPVTQASTVPAGVKGRVTL